MENSEDSVASTTARKPWTRMKRDLGVVLWSSFLASGVGTMVFFAYFDPQLLAQDDVPPWLADRMFAYGVGFFFFWLIAAASGALVAYLLDTDHERLEPPRGAEREP